MSFWSSIGKAVSGIFGGGSNLGSDIFKALLGGIGGSADAKLDVEALVKKAEAEGKEQRKTSLFEYQLLDYGKQQDKVRKRAALDTYGQFNQIAKWAPSYVPKNPAIQTPAMPDPNK